MRQETTLEEVAEKYANDWEEIHPKLDFEDMTPIAISKIDFIKGAKWQQEQDRNVYLNGYVDGSREQAKLMYSEEDLECAWNSSDQNMRFQFSSSAYKGITFKQWLEKYENER